MTSERFRSIVNRGTLFTFALSTLLICGVARAQSPIVFMTNTVTPNDDSRLTRFNNGVQSFAVGLGPNAAFQGVTIYSVNNNVLVADFVAEAIQSFSTTGAYLGAFASFTDPVFLESDAVGNVYTTRESIGPPGVTRFNFAGAITQTYLETGMTSSRGVDADAAGNVYVADMSGGNSRLYKFAANGTFLNSVAIGGTVDDVSIDEAGQQLYVAIENQSPNGVKVFDISGATPSLVGTRPTPVDSVIIGLHYAPASGNLLMTDFGALSNDPRGLEYSSAGVLLREYRPTNISVPLDITTFVPEPTSLTLLATSLFVAACIGRRARR
ncbi:MAG: hypothetical protein WD669_10105 [Pirellulales bacterium]